MITRFSGTLAIVICFIALAITGTPVCAQDDGTSAGTKVADVVTAAVSLNKQRVANLVQLTTDFDVLIFALNQEYLAASFWNCAAYGRPLQGDKYTGGGPDPIGCKKAPLSGLSQSIVEEVAFDEAAHVLLLRANLGKLAPPIPQIDLTAGPKFIQEASGLLVDPGDNEASFWINAFLLSDFEPTAYRGAIPLLRHKLYISVGVGIQGTEGYHAGIIRKVLIDRKDEVVQGKYVSDIIQNVSDRRDSLSAAGSDIDQGIILGGKPNLVPTDSNGLVFARDVRQVLSVLYDGGSNGGGFFPNGVRGRVRSTLQG